MFSALLNLSIRTRDLVQRHAPTNRFLRWLRTRHPAHWPSLVMLYGVAFLACALFVSLLVHLGLPQLLYLLFFLFLYDGAKLIINGLKGFATARKHAHRNPASAEGPTRN
ncbi:hypothetical protein [Nesterenkonia alkaliphila]|uniref:Uncharacterized protein n=1 Tax=Nesterenkonia alkaliphila TaxID=1463631 RepID=A0A7K1UF83_9MICC|nr:hypothetical protein [Nesterenkonia alkaliphila]MVT25118.1 hypothetical protein [Nesterenkonia alkaliphila]